MIIQVKILQKIPSQS